MLKKLIFFINLFFFSTITILFSTEIIPLKKPIQTKAEKDQKLLIDVMKPLPKPIPKKIVEEIEKKPEGEIKLKAEKDLGIILPKKKPLIAGTKKIDTAKKSKYYNKKDFEIAKKAISEMKQAKWPTALKTAKRAKDKSIYNFIQWRHLLTKGNKASYYDYKTFIDRNEDYPRLGRIRYLAEHKLSTDTISPKKIINWFGVDEPLSGFGKMILGESIILNGNTQKGISYIKEGWITAELSKSELRFYRKKFKKYLNADDYIKRADYLAWNNKYWDLKRLLRYLPKDYELLYTARQLLMSKSYGVDNAISKVPAKFKNDAGLNYDRLKWRRKRGRVDSSVEILVKIKNTKDYLVRPDKWWFEREIISRSLIYKKKYALAYKIASNHALTDGPEYAAAEWMSGWIALSFLDDPLLAKDHFENFYKNVGYPISTSRGAYWLAKTYQKLGKKELANEWFGKASNFLTTYYGQLAFMELNPNQPFELSKDIEVSKEYRDYFFKKELVKTIYLLDELDEGHQEAPGVGSVYDQALQEHPRDLLLHGVLAGLSEHEEQDAGEVVRVVVRIAQLVGHRIEKQEAALGAERLREVLEELHAGGSRRGPRAQLGAGLHLLDHTGPEVEDEGVHERHAVDAPRGEGFARGQPQPVGELCRALAEVVHAAQRCAPCLPGGVGAPPTELNELVHLGCQGTGQQLAEVDGEARGLGDLG